jgi:RimJ/RimL family protein N-acetyltransferase
MTVITTKRLTLGLYHQGKGHLETMVRWLNDSSITRYSEQRHQCHDVESQLHYVMDGPRIFREIHAEEKFIGTITAHIDEDNSVANVGILIGEKSEWGKGYGTEAWIALCDHLLNNGIRKVEAGAMSINLGMIHIFRKSKMFYEGRRHAHFLCGQETVDMVLWGKFS